MTTSTFDNPLNLLNDSSNIYIMVSSSEILIILKSRDGLRMTSIIIVRDTHLVLKEVTHLMNVIAYMVFHQTTKGENSLLTMPLQLKRQMRVRYLQTKSQQSSSFSLTKEQYNSLLTLFQQSQSQLATTASTEHHQISNTSTSIICNLKSLPKSVLWILDSGATHHISSSLENFAIYRIILDIPIKLPSGTTFYENIKGIIIYYIHSA